MTVIFQNIHTNKVEAEYDEMVNIPQRGDFIKIGLIVYEVTGITHHLDDFTTFSGEKIQKHVCIHIRNAPSQVYYWGKIDMVFDYERF